MSLNRLTEAAFLGVIAIAHMPVLAQEPGLEELKARHQEKISQPWFEKNGFTEDLEKAMAESERTGKPIFAYFTATYFSCYGCRNTEKGLFATEEFQAWTDDVVPFTAIATNLPGRPYDDLAWKSGAQAYPWFAILNAKGRVTSHLPLDGAKTRNMEGLKQLLVRHREYEELVGKADKTDDEETKLLRHDVMNGNVGVKEALVRLKAIDTITQDQHRRLESAIISFPLQVYEWNANPERVRTEAALMKECVEWHRFGRQCPLNPRRAKVYFDFILRHAETENDVDLFANAMKAVRECLGKSDPDYVKSKAKALGKLKDAR